MIGKGLKETSPMLLHHCINLNIARSSGHLFEKNVRETEKLQKGYQVLSELQT